MRISQTWLREWLETEVPFADLAGSLTKGGFEVEGQGTAGPSLAKVVVGRIKTAVPHPQAERLKICEVEAGFDATLTIVCGAPNARPGLLAPLALPGAVVGGRAIAVSDLRGVTSYGMLCSASELGMGGAPGLWELPADAPVGMALDAYWHFAEPYIEVSVTPNRGDCLSMKGMAREIAALTSGRFRAPRPRALRTSGATPHITVKASERCPRYCARTVTGINPDAGSPGWLIERLRVFGVQPRHPVVDATNYIMYDLGQPLHAFDAQCVSGDLVVRLASEGEEIALLDGSTRALAASDLVIADEKGPLAVAGVMGGLRAAVGPQTRSVVLEAAYFRPDTLSRTARRLGLATDAALRFERGVDPDLASLALERVTALIMRLAGGTASPAADHIDKAAWPVIAPIRLRVARILALLGLVVPRVQVTRFLKSLGMEVAASHGDLLVTPPRFRFDVRSEIDLIEEIARLTGYDEIPTVELPLAPVAPQPTVFAMRRAADLLVDRDYQEVINFSLQDPHEGALLGLSEGGLLRNPLAAPLSALRTSLIPGLLTSALHNRRRQQSRVRLFEMGLCFVRGPDGSLSERTHIAGLALGSAGPEQWGLSARPVDFFDIKGDVEVLAQAAGVALQVVSHEQEPLQPHVAGALLWADEPGGIIGALAPQHRARLGFDEPVYVFEISAEIFGHKAMSRATEPPRFPSVRRDLALVVSEEVAAGTVLETIRKSAGALLKELVLFDVFRGEGLDLGKKSLALGLTLQDFSRTLTDEAVEEIVARTVAALHQICGAQLRQ